MDGVGLGASRQKWDYLPNAHSDFIFAIIGEELGLLGALFVLAMFAILLFAGVRIAVAAPDTFGRLVAAGITGWIGLQTIINLGAVTGLMPITGVPLALALVRRDRPRRDARGDRGAREHLPGERPGDVAGIAADRRRPRPAAGRRTAAAPGARGRTAASGRLTR